MNNAITQQFDRIKSFIEPDVWRICRPRRYAPPHGYPNPDLNAAWLAHTIEVIKRLPRINDVQRNCAIVASKVISASCPTVFVGHDFVEALTMTDPPEDMTLSDIQWPWDAVTFVLPEAFSKKHFGRNAPFLRVARQGNEKFGKGEIIVDDDPDAVGFFVVASTYDDADCFDFCAGQRVSQQIKTILTNDKQQDFTVNGVDGLGRLDYTTGKPMDNEADKIFMRRFSAVAIHLLLALNAVPEQLEPERMTRPARIKRGVVVKEELWHPRILGGNYSHTANERAALGGTHASPRLHVRRGHWRHQRHGKGNALTKMKWLKWMLIGAEEKEAA